MWSTRPLRALRTTWLARPTTRPFQQPTARDGHTGMASSRLRTPSPQGRATLGGRLRPLDLDPPAPPPSHRPSPAGAPAVTGPLAQPRQRPRRRITPSTNTTTTTTISTHNHVDMAASLVGAGQFKLTLLPPTRANNSVTAKRPPGPRSTAAARGLAGAPAPRDLPADPGWPRQCGPINCGTYGTERPAKTPVSTALGRRSMVRMGHPPTGRAVREWRPTLRPAS
jgi:hypothetical protein